MVEHLVPNQRVAGSIPVSRFSFYKPIGLYFIHVVPIKDTLHFDSTRLRPFSAGFLNLPGYPSAFDADRHGTFVALWR